MQIDEKYKFIAKSSYILELGAAPGGWTQVVKERMANNAKVLACDLVEIQPIYNVTILTGDFITEITPPKVEELLGSDKVDLLLSDMAPAISGNSIRDQAQMLELGLGVLDKARELLNQDKGILLTKMFQGSDLQEFIQGLRRDGYKHKIVKPLASRSTSKEIYIIASRKALNT
ncbi:MAG: RlmE family RNA methyltransferase [Candidatus Portiera sp.]|nr:RlmE family RNA methyltransferase [Portiera sp.]